MPRDEYKGRNYAMNTNTAPMTPAEFAERLDALAAEYMGGAPACATERQARLRSPRATWCAILSHAEHRIHQANRIAAAAGGTA